MNPSVTTITNLEGAADRERQAAGTSIRQIANSLSERAQSDALVVAASLVVERAVRTARADGAVLLVTRPAPAASIVCEIDADGDTPRVSEMKSDASRHLAATLPASWHRFSIQIASADGGRWGSLVVGRRVGAFDREQRRRLLRLAQDAALLIRTARGAEQNGNVSAVRAATHLIRNSLNTIALCADVMLQTRTTPPQGRAKIELMRRVAHETTGFLEDMADAVRGATAPDARESSWTPLPDLVAAAQSRVRQAAAVRDVQVSLEVSEDCPAVLGDRAKLIRALHAVLTYAVAETGDGTVRVRAEPAAGPHGGIRLRIAFGGPDSAAPAPPPKDLGPFDPSAMSQSREWMRLSVAQATIAGHGGSMWTERTTAPSTIGVWIPTPALQSLR